ncbi:MAG TPA: hypothetical protein PKY31_14710 [Spirochaetota bacterium]|nr:hypothetical protein [Spirochaetota bacterium]
MGVIQLSLGSTGIVLVVMGFIEAVLAARNVVATGGGKLMKVFVILYGFLLVDLGLSIAAMRGSMEGQGLFLSIMALIIAGPFFLLFPSRPRALFLEMVRSMERKYAMALIYSDAVFRVLLGSAFVYIAARAAG